MDRSSSTSFAIFWLLYSWFTDWRTSAVKQRIACSFFPLLVDRRLQRCLGSWCATTLPRNVTLPALFHCYSVWMQRIRGKGVWCFTVHPINFSHAICQTRMRTVNWDWRPLRNRSLLLPFFGTFFERSRKVPILELAISRGGVPSEVWQGFEFDSFQDMWKDLKIGKEWGL